LAWAIGLATDGTAETKIETPESPAPASAVPVEPDTPWSIQFTALCVAVASCRWYGPGAIGNRDFGEPVSGWQ